MEQVTLLRKQIEEINEELAEAMKSHVAALHRLSQIPGVDLYAAQELLAEAGPGATAFPSAGQFASWMGICPGSTETAGINYSHRSAKRNRFLRRLFCQIAWAASHTKDTFFASLFVRLKPRREAKGAAWAVAHRIATVVWLVLHNGVEYRERGPGRVSDRALLRKFRNLMRQFDGRGLDLRSLLNEHLTSPA